MISKDGPWCSRSQGRCRCKSEATQASEPRFNFFSQRKFCSVNFKKRDLAISEGEVCEPHTVGSLKNDDNRQHLLVAVCMDLWVYVYFLSLRFFLRRELPLKAKQIKITVVPPAAQH